MLHSICALVKEAANIGRVNGQILLDGEFRFLVVGSDLMVILHEGDEDILVVVLNRHHGQKEEVAGSDFSTITTFYGCFFGYGVCVAFRLIFAYYQEGR